MSTKRTNNPAVRIRGLGKRYKLYRHPLHKALDAFGLLGWVPGPRPEEFWALRDLDLEVARGERLGIVGRNGAGKSTLLKALIGTVDATEGSIDVHGSIQAMLELGTGFHPEFTGRQNIRASLGYQGLPDQRIATLEPEIIDFAELDSFIDQPFKTYSAGMAARLSFATATAVEPEILVIDEVLGAGDAYFAGKCVERMKSLTVQSGATVLFVSHDLASVELLCDRVIWVDRGRIVADGRPVDIIKEYYASILAQEERRLRHRNAGARTTDNHRPRVTTEAIEMLCRILPSEALRAAHPIRQIALRRPDGTVLAAVEPGAPMDNDPSQQAFLMADPEYMLWGHATGEGGSRYREVRATGGRYGHAPFVFRLAAEQRDELERPLELVIEHRTDASDSLQIQVFDGDEYHTVGTLDERENDGWRTARFDIPAAARDKLVGPSESVEPLSAAAPEPALAPSTAPSDQGDTPPQPAGALKSRGTDKFFSDRADLIELSPRAPGSEEEKVLFDPGEPIELAARLTVFAPIAESVFCIEVGTTTGTVISVLYWPVARPLHRGDHSFTIRIDDSGLRQGEYLISAALMREVATDNSEVVYYCRWNRAVSFRVEERRLSKISGGLIALKATPADGSPLEFNTAVSGEGTPR